MKLQEDRASTDEKEWNELKENGKSAIIAENFCSVDKIHWFHNCLILPLNNRFMNLTLGMGRATFSIPLAENIFLMNIYVDSICVFCYSNNRT